VNPGDLGTLQAAYARMPLVGVRVRCSRCVAHVDGHDRAWRPVQHEVTVTGYVAALSAHAVTIDRGPVMVAIRLADILDVDGQVTLEELAHQPSPAELDELLGVGER
jgi:hypothetical protein